MRYAESKKTAKKKKTCFWQVSENFFCSSLREQIADNGCLTEMKKTFSSDARRMRYAETEKTAKKKDLLCLQAFVYLFLLFFAP